MLQRTPWPISVIGAIALVAIVAPLVALFGRVDWGSLASVAGSASARNALSLSFVTALAATTLCVLLGVPLAVVIARARPRLAAVLRALIMVPLLMPPLVGGLALLSLLGRNGTLGEFLRETFGFQLPFSTAAVVIAQTFVALPFLVISVEQALRAIDPRYELVARTLGASGARVWWRVTVPLLRPAIVAGATLSFARALSEFGATAMFAGNREGVTRTMPLAIYNAFNGGAVAAEEAYILAVILVVAAVLVLVALRGWRAGEIR